MMQTISRWFKPKQKRTLKDLSTEIAVQQRVGFHKLGVAPIKVSKIVGSVGRATELDEGFRYRTRSATQRYQMATSSTWSGEPTHPIKVYKVKRSDSEYYVLDGHHRLAAAIQRGWDEINAEIIEVQIGED